MGIVDLMMGLDRLASRGIFTYDEHDLECKPDAVRDQPSPLHVVEPDRVDERSEEPCAPPKKLKYRDPLCTLREREKFHKKCYDAVSKSCLLTPIIHDRTPASNLLYVRALYPML